MFVALLVYIVGAVGYNRYALGLRGTDQLPAFHFISIPSIMRSIQNCFHTIQDRVDDMRSGQRGYGGPAQWGSWGPSRRGTSGYGRIPTEASESQTMMGDPRFSLDAEEEEDGPVVFNDHEQQKRNPQPPQVVAQSQAQKVLPPTPQPTTPTVAVTQPQSPPGVDPKGVIRL